MKFPGMIGTVVFFQIQVKITYCLALHSNGVRSVGLPMSTYEKSKGNFSSVSNDQNILITGDSLESRCMSASLKM